VRVSASAQRVAQFVGGGKLAHFGLIEQVRQTVRNGGDVGGGKHHARHKFKPPVFVFRVS
jgi:hypothetical protein